MEMKYVVPDMAQSFGILEFAGESEPVFEKDKNNRRVLTRRSYNLYSDVQKGENVVVLRCHTMQLPCRKQSTVFYRQDKKRGLNYVT